MRQLAWLLVLLASLPVLAADEVRTWTDVNGRKIQAQFVREVDGDVTFIKDGKLIALPLDQLSDEDQKFIRDAEAGKKVEDSTPPAGAPRKDTDTDNSLPIDSGSTTDTKSSLTKQRVVAEERTWRDFRGRQSVGKFVRMHQGNVVLLSGARALSIPFYNLSRADREYVRELLAARGESGHLPAEPPDEPVAAAEPQPAGEAGSGAGAVGNAPPVAPSAPVAGRGPAAGRGGVGSDANDRLAKMQEENRKRMAENNERREKAAQQTKAMAQQSMQRMKASMASQQESPNDIVGTCSNCKKGITRELSGGMKCPHCGVIWQYEVDEFGHKKEIPGAAAAIAAGEGSSSAGQGSGRTGWEMEPRHYVKLFTRIIIPIAVMLFAAIAAAVRGRR